MDNKIVSIMVKKKKPFPSQVRYHKNNPVLSFRLSREDKDQLEEIAKMDDMSGGQYVRIPLVFTVATCSVFGCQLAHSSARSVAADPGKR